MRVLEQLPQQPLNGDCALTVGTFDGVHRGHALLLQRLRQEAHQRNLQTRVLTFQDMPYCYFQPEGCARLLTLPQDKAAALSSHHLDDALIIPFDASVANQNAQDFVTRVLIEKLRMKLLVVGPDFALGKGREGNIDALKNMGEKLGFEVVVLEEKLGDEGPISSTRIRECVEDGHMKTAARLSGRPFMLRGEVVSGQQLGRKIGVPTINLEIHPRKVLPSNGVYAAYALFDDNVSTQHKVALNIGTRPTVDGKKLSVEFHVIHENIETPPQRVRLKIVERLRDERKFNGVNELVTQMRKDIARASEILS